MMNSKQPSILIGIGQDSHVLEPETSDKVLVLGGYTILNHPGLKGNSDADVILHSLFNAISSAIGEKSLGYYSDPMCLKQGITDSSKYLELILRLMDIKGYKLSNISISLECKTPNIQNVSKNIKQSISNKCNLNLHNIGVTATSGEGLTSFGRGEGIACISQVLLTKKPTPFYKTPIFIITVLILAIYLLMLQYTLSNSNLL